MTKSQRQAGVLLLVRNWGIQRGNPIGLRQPKERSGRLP